MGSACSPDLSSLPSHHPSLQVGCSDRAAAWRVNIAQEDPSAGEGKHLCIPPCGSRSGREDIRGAEEVWIGSLWVVDQQAVHMILPLQHGLLNILILPLWQLSLIAVDRYAGMPSVLSPHTHGRDAGATPTVASWVTAGRSGSPPAAPSSTRRTPTSCTRATSCSPCPGPPSLTG